MDKEVRTQRKEDLLRSLYKKKYLDGMREDKILEEMEAESGYSKVTIIQYLGSRKTLREEAVEDGSNDGE